MDPSERQTEFNCTWIREAQHNWIQLVWALRPLPPPPSSPFRAPTSLTWLPSVAAAAARAERVESQQRAELIRLLSIIDLHCAVVARSQLRLRQSG